MNTLRYALASALMLVQTALLQIVAGPIAFAQSAATGTPAVALSSNQPSDVTPGRVVPPVRPVTETFFGTAVTDNYRYMEDTRNPDVVAFMRGESAHARQVLDSIPGRAAMQRRIDDLSQGLTSVSGVQITGSDTRPRLYYYKLAPGMSNRALYVRDGFTGTERRVFDVAAASARAGARLSLDYFIASPDGRYVLLGVAAGGSEDTSLRLVEVGAVQIRETGLVIDRIGFADETFWAPDSKSFFYNRLPPPVAGAAKNRYLNSQAFRHVVGRPATRDELVFGNGVSGVRLADIDIPSVRITADGRNLVGRVEHGDAREISLYVASAGDLGSPNIQWRRVVQPADEVTSFVLHNNVAYLLTKKNAPRYKVVRMSVSPGGGIAAAPASTTVGFAGATTIVPHGDTVLAQIAVARDALYIREMVGGVDRLQRLNFSNNVFSGGKLEFVRLDFDLAIRQLITSPSRSGALLRLESWTSAPHYVTVAERSGNITPVPLHPRSNVDFSDIVELRLKATAKDGVIVPVSLVYRKSTMLHGNNPTLLRGYGAYGIVQLPSFVPTNLAWLERGGILATCHVRGGGEFGEAWHRGGQKATKPNTWRDMIACAEFLITQGFTSPAHLGIQGGSAGGLTVGRALTERPDLFAAVVPAVGVLDALRMEFTPNGPPNIPEFGTVKNEEGFKGLLAMSAMHHVKEGTRYPAVLLMHGVNDPRVEVWQSAKMAARLNAANASVSDAKPVLLRLDYDAGHGVGSSRNQRNAETADVFSFLLWQFGDPAFQPMPTAR
ncbi:MAG: prolyl oligopeptidase family serine peptidase [Burkholderiales bacterium]